MSTIINHSKIKLCYFAFFRSIFCAKVLPQNCETPCVSWQKKGGVPADSPFNDTKTNKKASLGRLT